MGSRPMFHALEIKDIGINKFETIIKNYGLIIKKRRRRIVTTHGIYENQDTNLINNFELSNINQVVVGDITYFQKKERTYYVFTLKDAYSKRIIGLYGSDNMMATNAVKTLRQVIYTRGKENLSQTIHHSDAGSQYKSNIYKKLLSGCKMQMSIANNCLQNGMAEQLNDVIKNSYLQFEEIKNVYQLNESLKKIKKIINEERPVAALGYRTPAKFERWIAKLCEAERPKMKLHDFTKAKCKHCVGEL